jgi:hypothetical protein
MSRRRAGSGYFVKPTFSVQAQRRVIVDPVTFLFIR